jgi:conjugative transposon TraN protein
MTKKAFSLFIFLFLVLCVSSQDLVTSKNITVDFDRVVHIVFTSDVEYVAPGSEYIEAEIIKESPKVVRILALEENFPEQTNVTIISKSGNVYSYNVSYKVSSDEPSVFYPDSDREAEYSTILLNKSNAAHLIFPNDIVYFRQGNEINFQVEKTSAENILMVKGKSELNERHKSNLFTIDQDGNDYNINLLIGNNNSYTYRIGQAEAKANVALNERDIERLSKAVLNKKRNIYTEGLKKNKFEFSLNGIYVDKEDLLFLFEIKNESNIDLDIDFVKCFYVDEKESKNVAQQMIEVDAKFNFNFKNKIEAKTSNKFVMVFDKFTIPDKKVFKVQIYEKGGGRHINFNIKNKVLIKADAIE